MFGKPSPEAIALGAVIVELETEMQREHGDSEDYGTLLTRLERLYKIREKNSPKGLDPNTLILAGTNVLGIVIIVAYEHAHPLVSKALALAGRLR